MKGIVFSEFIDMVERQFSLQIVDRIIEESQLPSGGAYTSVGTYPHAEMVQLVQRLSAVSGLPVPTLLKAFGEYLFGRFVALYPQYFQDQASSFAFLATLESKIHSEVRKLYPDAELPRFEHDFPDAQHMTLFYRSSRPFADLAEGLILGCARHFGERIAVTREDLPGDQGSHVRFRLALGPVSATDRGSANRP